MQNLKEYVEKVKGHLLTDLKNDEMRKNDPIIGRFMQGRIVVENHYIETLDNILDMLKEK